MLVLHFHLANSLNTVCKTWKQFLLPPPTLCSSCLWHSWVPGLGLASANGGWHYLRAGQGCIVSTEILQTMWEHWPFLSSRHLVSDEAIKVNIFDILLIWGWSAQDRQNFHCPMYYLRQQSNFAMAAFWGQCKVDCYRGGAAGGEAVPQRKLQHGSWEKIRQCNLIIFQQLHAAGYGCLLDVSSWGRVSNECISAMCITDEPRNQKFTGCSEYVQEEIIWKGIKWGEEQGKYIRKC